MSACILWQNDDRSIALLDIPRSIEEAQGPYHGRGALISSLPLEAPYASLEPKSARALRNLPEPKIQDLLLQKHLQLALLEAAASKSVWNLPRLSVHEQPQILQRNGKRKAKDLTCDSPASDEDSMKVEGENHVNIKSCATSTLLPETTKVPPSSHYILGTLESTVEAFEDAAPSFDVVIMDPPWPNRSARRKRAYGISHDSLDIEALLSTIPLVRHLKDDALVGIWITNKEAFRDMLLGRGGFFDRWNLELVEEWVWLKITSHGEPICELNGTWRKPYEVLLLGRKKATGPDREFVPKRRVIIAVPDLHSRKPNLKALLEPMLPSVYQGLEVFARNLTQGWWAWGNEVMKFQQPEHWACVTSQA